MGDLNRNLTHDKYLLKTKEVLCNLKCKLIELDIQYESLFGAKDDSVTTNILTKFRKDIFLIAHSSLFLDSLELVTDIDILCRLRQIKHRNRKVFPFVEK